MCGRYALYSTDMLAGHYGSELPHDVPANFNAAPTQTMPVMTPAGLQLMRWGFIPRWAKDEKIGYKLINTRSESVFEKPMWRNAVHYQRCLVPANGFYEWKRTSDSKTPYYFYLPGEPLFSFAGIWSTWQHEGKEWKTYSILTTTPNKEMEPIHDRMPVIVRADDEATWLNAENDDIIAELLTPPPDGTLQRHEVSIAVNTTRANDETLIGPINSR